MRLTALALLLVVGCSSTDSTESTAADAGASDAGAQAADAGIDAAVSCVAPGGDCADRACCTGHTCVSDVNSPGKLICAANCLNASQCNTGCCTTLVEGTSKVCAPAAYCAPACIKPGGDCRTGECCSDGICVTSTADGTRCAAKCTTPGQCASGCCAPLSDTGELVCSPASFCL